MADDDTKTTEPSTETETEAPVRRRRPTLKKSDRTSGAGGSTAAEGGSGKPAKPAKVPKPAKDGTDGRTSKAGGPMDAARLRTLLARVLWAVCSIFALILALAVLLIAVEANADNELVRWIIARADNVDLGFFDLGNPIKDFDDKVGEIDDVKTALFNYGIAAIVWLLIGKFLDKVVRA